MNDPIDPGPRESWEHLIQFGWAPGGYLIKCGDCGEQPWWCDKRAWRCRPCAEKRHAHFLAHPLSDKSASSPNPAITPEQEWRALAERARDSLKHALAPFRPYSSRTEAERVLADLEVYLNK